MSIRQLSADLQEIAQRELDEDPARLQADIQHLKDWLSKQPHITLRDDDQWLVTFLRGCKFSLERAKSKIDLYYTLRTTVPELTVNIKLSHPHMDELLNAMPIVLPTSGPGQPRVLLMRPADQDLEKFTITEYMCAMYLFQQVLLKEDDVVVVTGLRSLMDFEGATMAHFTAVTPLMMKKMVALGQDAAPIRMKGIHYLNTPPGFETLFNIMKAFLSEKNRSRIRVYNKNYEEMYEEIPKEIFPTEYGGKAGTIEQIRGEWKKKIFEQADWLEAELRCRTDESLRLGEPCTAEGMFGVEGSFRKLQLD